MTLDGTVLLAAPLIRRPPVAVTSSLFTIHYSLFTQLTPFGDPIFRCTTKDRGERRAKGIAIPLDPRGNVLEDAGRALCLRVRNGAFDAIKSRMACTSALLPCALRAAGAQKD